MDLIQDYNNEKLDEIKNAPKSKLEELQILAKQYPEVCRLLELLRECEWL